MIAVGLTGKAGAGKDTVADRLVDKHDFQKVAFADPLKFMLLRLDPILDDQGTRLSHIVREFSHSQKAESEAHLKAHFPEYRRLLQVLGTDCIRAIDPDFWVKATMSGVMDKDAARVVFSDVRFANEVAAIQDLTYDWRYGVGFDKTVHAEVWHIDRDVPGAGGHSSETGAGSLGEDLTIDNDRDLQTLYRDVDTEAIGLTAADRMSAQMLAERNPVGEWPDYA